MKTVLKIIGIIFLIIMASIALLLFGMKSFFNAILTAPMVPDDYIETVNTGGELETKYLTMGDYEVEHTKGVAKEEWGEYIIYYPKELEQNERTYPVVVFVNGTGVYASRYPTLFEHLASWGFIVLGNEDPSTWEGTSADATLEYILNENVNPNSLFYKKVDIDHIGISGHSQGGVGTFNAITVQKHHHLYKSAVILSPTEEEMAEFLKIPYDSSKVTIPVMILAGTENDVISLEKMQDMYNKITTSKVIARKSNQSHGEMLYCADGYVTAWFMWQLKGDAEAARVFLGEDAEIMSNSLYQDQQINIMK